MRNTNLEFTRIKTNRALARPRYQKISFNLKPQTQHEEWSTNISREREKSHNRHNANIVLMSHGNWAQFRFYFTFHRPEKKYISIFNAPNQQFFLLLDLFLSFEANRNWNRRRKKLRDLLQIRHEPNSLSYFETVWVKPRKW